MIVYIEKEIAQNFTIEMIMDGILLYERPLSIIILMEDAKCFFFFEYLLNISMANLKACVHSSKV